MLTTPQPQQLRFGITGVLVCAREHVSFPTISPVSVTVGGVVQLCWVLLLRFQARDDFWTAGDSVIEEELCLHIIFSP